MSAPLVLIPQPVELSQPEPCRPSKITANHLLSQEEMIESLAKTLEDMLDENCTRYTTVDEIPVKTPFHAKKLPSISIRDYIKRFATHAKCNDNVFVLAMIYLDKIAENVENFSLDSFNVHRIILISLTLAVKCHDDNYYKNSYYAKIGGVTLEEFNSLELEYLVNYINFALYFAPDQYFEYYEDLANYHQTHDTKHQDVYGGKAC